MKFKFARSQTCKLIFKNPENFTIMKVERTGTELLRSALELEFRRNTVGDEGYSWARK